MTQVQLKARNTVVLCVTPGKPGDTSKGVAPTPPVTKEIEPGKLFMTDAETAKALTSGVKPAAEVYKVAETDEGDDTPKKPARKPPAKKAPAPKKEEAPAGTDPDTGTTGKSDRI